ncbi:MAG: ferredoxin family protein [Candidatus Eremiobacteraeota bacterium]|nr:ferredoxin family protein [Candidatus Eremiobacteraeota bacterium]
MPKVIIDRDRCKGCGFCVHFCPQNVLELSSELNVKGLYPAYVARPEDCIMCGICALMCPDAAMTVWKLTEEEQKAEENEKSKV